MQRSIPNARNLALALICRSGVSLNSDVSVIELFCYFVKVYLSRIIDFDVCMSFIATVE